MTPSPTIMIPIVAGVGNALMTLPLVRQLKQNLPQSRIIIVARIPAMAEPFSRLPEVDHTRIMQPGQIGMAKSVLPNGQPRPDLFLVPFPSNRWQYTALAFASLARRRIMHSYAVGRYRSLGFLSATRMPAVRGIHDVLQNLYLLRLLGFEPDITEAPRFHLNDADHLRADSLLAEAGIDPRAKPIAIHPGSATTILAKLKRWPPASYAQLIQRLRDEFPNPLIILEGPDEAGVGAEILSHLPLPIPILRLRGPLSEAAAILHRSSFYVGSDSGLAHLAASVGTPPVTIFGPADPDRVCPFNHRHLVLRPKCSCCPSLLYPWDSPRPKLKHPDRLCVQTITVDDVLNAARRAQKT